MNEENLIPNSKRTPSELREMTSNGGKKSGEVRRRKKNMKQKLQLLLSLPAACENDLQELEALGIEIEDADNEMIIIKGLFLKAANGDVAAFREIRNILGKDNSSAELELKKKELKLKETALKNKGAEIAVEDDGLVEALMTKSKDVFTNEN